MAKKIHEGAELENFRKLPPKLGAQVYAELRADVTKAGILDRDYSFYAIHSLLELTGLVVSLYLYIVLHNPIYLIAVCIAIGFFEVRLGGLIHDAGHRAIFKSTLLNDIYGYFCSFLIAFPFYVWRFKHNMHHAHTNEEGGDPDLEVPISFTPSMLARKGFIVEVFSKYQAWLYYPFGSLVAFTMRLKAFRFYLANFNSKIALIILLQGIGMFCWYILPFFVFPFWKALLFFVLTNEITGFYMLNVFAPNHKGMPQLEKGTKLSFIEHQITVSRNIYGHWLTDYMYLGLNRQIEHHLFPNCPRNKLGLITPFVRKLCRKYKLEYTQMSILESSKFILSELNEATKLAKAH